VILKFLLFTLPFYFENNLTAERILLYPYQIRYTLNNRKMKKWLLAACTGVLFTLGGCSSEIVATRPADVIYTRPLSPGPGNIWIGGDWIWAGGTYRWQSGHWDRGRPGHIWHEGHWEGHNNGFRWRKGHW
jgi:hypothetical protein